MAVATGRQDALSSLLKLESVDASWVLETLALRRPGLISGAIPGLLLQLDDSALSMALDDVKRKRPFAWEAFLSSLAPKSAPCGMSAPASTAVPEMKPLSGSDSYRSIDSSVPLLASLSTATMSKGERTESHRALVMTKAPKLQFCTATYYFSESEGLAKLQVIRLGALDQRSVVTWVTEDGAALAGERYIASSGTLEFGPGEKMKEFDVDIIRTGSWQNILDFTVHLKSEGSENCVLSGNQSVARVYIIDADVFPTTRFKTEILERRIPEVPKVMLFLEFLKMFTANPVIRRGMLKTFLVDQVHNLVYLLGLFMNVYLVDYILRPSRSADEVFFGDKRACLMLIVLLNLGPFGLLYFLDMSKFTFRVGGTSRETLQTNILRSVLFYTRASRDQVKDAEVVLAISQDCISVVSDGLNQVLAFAKSVGQLLAILSFKFLAAWVFGEKVRTLLTIIVMFFVYPALLFLFLALRSEVTRRMTAERQKSDSNLVTSVEQCLANSKLITDYNQRPVFVHKFVQVVREHNASLKKEKIAVSHNRYFALLLSELIVVIWIMVGGTQVINEGNKAHLGMFLAVLNILRQLGHSYVAIYEVAVRIMSTFPSLEFITFLMNLPTDVFGRKRDIEQRIRYTLVLRDEVGQSLDNSIAIDVIPIRFAPFKFNYTDEVKLEVVEPFEIPQGELVAFVGPRGEGKTTLIKILGNVLHPKGDSIGVLLSCTMRVIHVMSEPIFFAGTLMENLRFGAHGEEDSNEQRILKICRRLGLSERILRLVKSTEKLPWLDVLSQTESHLLCLARALAANPQMLCLHKPALTLDEASYPAVLESFREYVDNRGYEHDPEKAWKRRQRTCCFTTSRLQGVEAADRIICVSKSLGMKQIPKSEVTLDLLHVSG
eukprot:gnl/TRDRNA2_/TRDRNA2_177661_c6_seq1.p1 gnl/TRDRNA2_/TRDRNA2_177661_c6~~gnl/TRDRNA2_/TRDRNA2_177661_c6_seq1.p1  ORF type:complete len:903 (+),score=134.69 gnl/TRDRNA2_/TRDRNA2_177661_c6_seq1:44-2710(+)